MHAATAAAHMRAAAATTVSATTAAPTGCVGSTRKGSRGQCQRCSNRNQSSFHRGFSLLTRVISQRNAFEAASFGGIH
jgi:hypothetical protein